MDCVLVLRAAGTGLAGKRYGLGRGERLRHSRIRFILTQRWEELPLQYLKKAVTFLLQ